MAVQLSSRKIEILRRFLFEAHVMVAQSTFLLTECLRIMINKCVALTMKELFNIDNY